MQSVCASLKTWFCLGRLSPAWQPSCNWQPIRKPFVVAMKGYQKPHVICELLTNLLVNGSGCSMKLANCRKIENPLD